MAVFRVYYPSNDGVAKEDFSGPYEQAKAAAEDFAANFKREQVIIHEIKDSYNSGDPYDDGDITGTVKYTQVNADGVREVVIESEDEDGELIDITLPIEDSVINDSALHTLTESNLDDIFDKGFTYVTYDPSETNPQELADQLYDELYSYTAPNEVCPEVSYEVVDETTVKLYV